MKVVLDAGHGGYDPGAVNGKLYEKVAALAITKKVGSILSKNGVEVVYTRTTDKTLSLASRCNIANGAKASLFVSVHLNSAANKDAAGIETFCYPTSTKGKAAAAAIQEKLIADTGAKNRGVKTANFYVLKHTTMTAVLVETGFISNNTEAAKLFTEDYQNKIAAAIAAGILK